MGEHRQRPGLPRQLTPARSRRNEPGYGDHEITFTAYSPELPDDIGFGGACAADPSVAWLYCVNIAYEEVWATDFYSGPQTRLYIDPDSDVTMPERGQWLRISGAYDHPDAEGCAAAEEDVGLYGGDVDLAALDCRTHFVPSSIEVTAAP